MTGEYIQKALKKARQSAIFLLAGLAFFILVSLGMAGRGWAATETVKTFGLVESGTLTETSTFNDGSVVYVRVDNGSWMGSSYPSVTVIDDAALGNRITITVYDNGYLPDEGDSDIYYWGKFILQQGDGSEGGTSDEDDILELSNGETATISADLDGGGGAGTTTITAGYSTFTDHFPPFIASLSANPETFSPNGDGINDTTNFAFTLDDDSLPLYARIEVRKAGDDTIARRILTPSDGTISTGSHTEYFWDGKYDTNLGEGYVPAGDYKIYLIALDDAENSSMQTKTVTVDTTTPEIVDVAVSPGTISPQRNDGVADEAEIIFKATHTQHGLTVKMYLEAALIRDLTSDITVVSDHYSVIWDGKDDGDSYVADDTYTCEIKATNVTDIITTNTEGTVAVDNTAPSAPTDLSATAIAGGNIQLTWTASSSSDISQYNIYRATTSGGENYSSPTYTVSVGTTSYTDTSTSDGVSYYYVVRAQDTLGNEETNTNEVSAQASLSTALSAPTDLSATAIAGGNIQLAWTASSSSDISQYNIYRATTSGGEDYTSPTYTVSVGTNSYTDTSTSDGVSYYYVVRAQDNIGNIETNTNEVSATASATGPSFSSISADKSFYKDGDTITLTVTLDNHNTGCTLTADFSNIDDQYVSGGESVVNWGTDGRDNDGDGHVNNPAEQGVYVISYLISTVNSRADGSHSVPVTATNAAENSTSSSISLTLDNTAPSAPTNLSAAAVSGGDIKLTWTASSSSDISQYNIYRATTSGGENYSSPTYTVSSGTTSYTDTSTSDGVSYYYVVRAQDSAGNIETNTNEVSAQASISTALSAPTDLAATPLVDGSIQLTWTASSSSDISQYNIYRATTSGGEDYTSPTYTVSVGTNTYTDTSTTAEVTYYYVVRAQDSAGNIETNTNEVSATAGIPDTTPPPPPYFGISSFDSTTGKIVISGTTGADASQPQEVEIFLNGSSQGTTVADVNGDFTTENFTPGMILVSGHNFITVQATDKVGNKGSLSAPLKLNYKPQNLLSIVIRSTHVVSSGSSTKPIKVFYSVSQSALVTICIYNLKGELVKEWSQSANPGGEPSWNWFGKNMYEEDVNNGVYILRITASAGSESETVTKLVGVLH